MLLPTPRSSCTFHNALLSMQIQLTGYKGYPKLPKLHSPLNLWTPTGPSPSRRPWSKIRDIAANDEDDGVLTTTKAGARGGPILEMIINGISNSRGRLPHVS